MDFAIEDADGNDDTLVPYADLEKIISEQISNQLVKNRRLQAYFIKEGLESIIPAAKLQILLPRDLQEMLAGEEDINVEFWRANTEYGKEYEDFRQKNNGADHPTIELFWTFVQDNEDLRKQLLQFSMGYKRLPKNVFKERKYFIKSVSNPKLLPTASAWYDLLFSLLVY